MSPIISGVAAVRNGEETECSDTLRTPVKKVFREQLERLNRGLVAVKTGNGNFPELAAVFGGSGAGYSDTGMTRDGFSWYTGTENGSGR